MPLVHMLVGIPGSGKTTFGRKLQEELHCPVIRSDEVRNLHPTWDEDHIWPEIYRLCAVELLAGHDIIYDATNINPEVRKRFRDRLAPYNVKYDIGCYFINTDWHDCYERIKVRNTMPNERYFPLDKVQMFVNDLVPPTMEEGFVFVKIV